MNLYLKEPIHGRRAQDHEVKPLFGLDPKAKWPAEGIPNRVIQGITCWVLPLEATTVLKVFQRARAHCPSCGKSMPIGRLPQHAVVHGDLSGVYRRPRRPLTEDDADPPPKFLEFM